jgi:hypothetical protein
MSDLTIYGKLCQCQSTDYWVDDTPELGLKCGNKEYNKKKRIYHTESIPKNKL